MVSEVVSETFDGGTARREYETEEEKTMRMRRLGLLPGEGEETEFQAPRDPLEVIAELNREITKLEKMNLALINQVIDLGQTPVKTVVRTDPDADPEADTIVKK